MLARGVLICRQPTRRATGMKEGSKIEIFSARFVGAGRQAGWGVFDGFSIG